MFNAFQSQRELDAVQWQRVGYDFDGVLCKEYFLFGYLYLIIPKTAAKFRDKFFKPRYLPKYPGYILTGRPRADYKTTKEWLTRHNVSYTLLSLAYLPIGGDPIACSNYKYLLIEDFRIEVFFESSLMQVELLKSLKPNCKIVYINSMTPHELQCVFKTMEAVCTD